MIKLDPQPPMYKGAFTATILDSKEDSVKEEVKDNSDIKIYTNGLGFKGGIGVATVLYRKGVEELETGESLMSL